MSTDRPTLSLSPTDRQELTEAFPDTFASLPTYFTLKDAESPSPDMNAASAVAAVLADVVNSSDVDCPYYPCVLGGVSPLGDAFFDAVGVARDAVADVSGWENPKLEIVAAGEGKVSPWVMLAYLDNEEQSGQDLSDYVSDDEREAFDAAAKALEQTGPLVGVRLCTDDGASKVVLTLAQGPDGAAVGVLFVRIET